MEVYGSPRNDDVRSPLAFKLNTQRPPIPRIDLIIRSTSNICFRFSTPANFSYCCSQWAGNNGCVRYIVDRLCEAPVHAAVLNIPLHWNKTYP